jgi:hypothetical protein
VSVDHTRREINQLDNEIASLEKKRAGIEQNEADRAQKINSVQRSITKNTSASMLSSKSRQIQGYQNDLAKFARDKADVTKKIAEKRKKRAGTAVKLQNEEAAEREKEAKTQKAIQQGYEKRIIELNRQWATIPPAFKPLTDMPDTVECYDVFISHAWEDKRAFVDEFVEELIALGIKVWYDKNKIAWGDSLRAKIDEGLRKSRFGVVVISPHYIADGKYWTKTELDGLFQLENVNGKSLLPIWYNITKKEVINYSPIVAGKRAMTTASMTSKEIANELLYLLNTPKTEELPDGQTQI